MGTKVLVTKSCIARCWREE